MNEINLIDMLSYLEPELLEDDYIENDMSKFGNFFSQITDNYSGMPLVIKVIAFIIAGILVLAGIVMLIIKKKNSFKFRKKNSKPIRKIFKLVTN